MRVLNCLHRSLLGGGQHRVMWVGEELKKNDIETIPLFPLDDDKAFEDLLAERGFEYFRIKIPVIRKSIRSNLLFIITFPKVVREISRIIKFNNIDVVHVNGATNLQPVLAGIITGRKIIWHFNDMMTPKWYVKLIQPIFSYPLMSFAVSTTEIINHYKFNVKIADRTSVVPGPVPPLQNAKTDISLEKLGISKDAIIIGFISNLVPMKGCFRFLSVTMKLMQESEKIHAVIVGGEVSSQKSFAYRLRQQANTSRYRERIHFAGYQNNIYKWLNLFDIFVFPSESEACPIVLLQAMSMGVPMVVSNVGEIPRMVGDLDIPVVDPMNIFALSKGIQEVLCRSDRAKMELKQKMMARVNRLYSLAKVINIYKRMYLN